MEIMQEKLYFTPGEFSGTDSAAVQAAVDEAARLDIRVVVIPAKEDGAVWQLDTPVRLPGYMTVILNGCTVEAHGTAFTNSHAGDPGKRSLAGEEHKIFILGRHGGKLVCRTDAPQILLSNVRDCRIAGITFVGGGGLRLDYVRYSKVQQLRFQDCKQGVVFCEGCNNIILESIEARTAEEAILVRGGSGFVMGRDPEISNSILCRIHAKTGGAAAVALYAGENELRNLVIRDVTDDTPSGVSVRIGDGKDNGEIRDITVRGVRTARGCVETGSICDGMYYGNLHGVPLLTRSGENTREFLDESTMEIVLPQFDKDVDRPFLTPNEPEFYGATDSETIQNAVDAASHRGINCVVIPRWNVRAQQARWDIEKAIRVPSYMTIILLHSHLRQADFCYENIFINTRAYESENRCMAHEEHDLTFSGVGDAVLDGGIPNGLLEKTCLLNGFPDKRPNATVLFNNVRNLVLENFQIRQSRWYGTYFIHCDTCRISNLDFENWEDCCNRDGVDIRSGCHNFLVENITGTTGDDTVALNNLGNDGNDGRYVAGKDPDTLNILVRNVKADAGRWFTVRLLVQDRHKEQNITLDTIMDVSLSENKKRCGATIMVGSHEYHYKVQGELGDMAHITIRDVYSRSTRGVAFGGCNDDVSVSNLHAFDDCPYALAVIRQANVRDVHINGVFYRRNNRHLTWVGTADSEAKELPKESVNSDGTVSITSDVVTRVSALVMEFPNLKTDNFLAENLFVDYASTGIRLSGGGTVAVKNLNIRRLTGARYQCDAKSVVIEDGAVVSGCV